MMSAKTIPIIQISPQQIGQLLKHVRRIPPEKSEEFKDAVQIHIHNYFIERHQQFRQPLKKMKDKLEIIKKSSERIATIIKEDRVCVISEVIPLLNRGAFIKGYSPFNNPLFNDLEDYMWNLNLSAEWAEHNINFRLNKFHKGKNQRPGIKADIALDKFLNDLSWLWFDTFGKIPGASTSGPFACFVYHILKMLHDSVTQEHIRQDPNIRDDLSHTQQAIRSRLKNLPIRKLKRLIA